MTRAELLFFSSLCRAKNGVLRTSQRDTLVRLLPFDTKYTTLAMALVGFIKQAFSMNSSGRRLLVENPMATKQRTSATAHCPIS